MKTNDCPKNAKLIDKKEDDLVENGNVTNQLECNVYEDFFKNMEKLLTNNQKTRKIIETLFLNQFPGTLKPEEIYNHYS